MATHSDITAADPASVPIVPRLETGDRLSRPEFERRYEAMPALKKAELIEGEVFVGSPVSETHGAAHARLLAWLVIYSDQTPGTRASDNTTVRLDLMNEVQPDGILRIVSGGQSKIVGEKGYCEGAPEFAAEIATSSVSRDLHGKRNLYRRHNVREYVVWRVMDKAVDWFQLVDGDYQQLSPNEQGLYRSREFPGLWLDPAALVRGEMSVVMRRLSEGIASAEHAALVARLAAQ